MAIQQDARLTILAGELRSPLHYLIRSFTKIVDRELVVMGICSVSSYKDLLCCTERFGWYAGTLQ